MNKDKDTPAEVHGAEVAPPFVGAGALRSRWAERCGVRLWSGFTSSSTSSVVAELDRLGRIVRAERAPERDSVPVCRLDRSAPTRTASS